jgi:hypothetical protein
MDRKKFDQIKEMYGQHASWAYWRLPSSDDNKRGHIGDLCVLDPDKNPDLLGVVHAKYILLGLNVSRTRASSPRFQNFHDDSPRGRDYRLRHAVMNTVLWGSYITDFFVDFVEPNAGAVEEFARNNPEEVTKQASARRLEIETVTGGVKPTLVALGRAAQRLVATHFNDHCVINVPHYSSYTKIEDYRNNVVAEIQKAGV